MFIYFFLSFFLFFSVTAFFLLLFFLLPLIRSFDKLLYYSVGRIIDQKVDYYVEKAVFFTYDFVQHQNFKQEEMLDKFFYHCESAINDNLLACAISPKNYNIKAMIIIQLYNAFNIKSLAELFPAGNQNKERG